MKLQLLGERFGVGIRKLYHSATATGLVALALVPTKAATFVAVSAAAAFLADLDAAVSFCFVSVDAAAAAVVPSADLVLWLLLTLLQLLLARVPLKFPLTLR